jgi:hypothetical protein
LNSSEPYPATNDSGRAPAADEIELTRAERRIWLFMLLYGAGGAAWFWVAWGWRAAAGIAVGAGLSCLNLFWLKAGVNAVIERAAPGSRQGSKQGPQSLRSRAVRRLTAAGALARYGILAVALYAIFISHLVVFWAVLAGLFASVGGITMEAVFLLYQQFRAD